jgi:hypothetical protein
MFVTQKLPSEEPEGLRAFSSYNQGIISRWSHYNCQKMPVHMHKKEKVGEDC